MSKVCYHTNGRRLLDSIENGIERLEGKSNKKRISKVTLADTVHVSKTTVPIPMDDNDLDSDKFKNMLSNSALLYF